MNKFLRWPAWIILAALALAALIPTLAVSHTGKSPAAHAAGTNPTIALPTIVHPFDTITITGQGFAPGDSVEITLDNDGYMLGSLSCDSNGNCSGQLMVPSSNVPQGTHQVIATSRSGLSAQMAVTFLPGLATFTTFGRASLTSGGPGTAFELDGGAFQPGETINVYWGTTNPLLLGAVMTSQYDGSFNVDFRAPVTVARGFYPIIAVRSQQTPASARTIFHILAPSMISSAGVRNNQAVHVILSGFLANEKVTLSWNANGGQKIKTFTVDSTGALDTYFAPPFAPKGAYTLLAVGNSSQLQAQSQLNIGPGILLSPNTANPGGTTVVNGGGFTPGETVNVYFQNTTNGVSQVTIDTSGSFSVLLSVPVTYSKIVSYYVYAVSTTTSDKAKAQFFYATPSIQMAGNCCSALYGTSFTLNGQGFVANETVTISAQNVVQSSPVNLGTVTAAADGTFSFTSKMPSAPYTNPRAINPANMFLLALGSLSKSQVSVPVYVFPNVIPTPRAGHIGQKIHLNGGGFGSGETVTVQLEFTLVATATTDANGFFDTTFIVPTSATPGNHLCNLCVTGNTTGAAVNVMLIILETVTMTPQQGPSGATITVNGYAFNSGEPISIYWYDPGTKTQTLLTTVITGGGGSFQTTVTAPANLVSGSTYDVVIQDAFGFNAQLPFQAT